MRLRGQRKSGHEKWRRKEWPRNSTKNTEEVKMRLRWIRACFCSLVSKPVMRHTTYINWRQVDGMRTHSQSGFNVIELAVVTVVVVLLVLALLPAVTNASKGANMTAVGTRGRDIYVAISGANTEREPLGLPSVWPSDRAPRLTTNSTEVECFNFTNSTDYFKYLCDEPRIGTERWSPFVAGFDYSKLAGGGVPSCTSGKLTPECNMWIIAKNVREDMANIVPVLITRNIDASSLGARAVDGDWDKSLRFDPEWEMPFGNRSFCLIRKGGAIFKAREKYVSYGVVYGKQTFEANVDKDQRPVFHPLKYLTPNHTVVPGDRAYAEGAIHARPSGSIWGRVKRDFAALTRILLPVGACVGVVYLLVAGLYSFLRYRKRRLPYLTSYGVGVGLFHYVASALWCCIFFLSHLTGADIFLTFLALAVLAQLAGIAFVLVCRRSDRAACQRGVKWMIAAPLIVCSVPAGVLLLIIFFECVSFELVVALLIMVIAVLTLAVVWRRR